MKKMKKLLLASLATLSIGAGLVGLSSCTKPMPGPQGEKGEQGIQGIQGEKGEQGIQGEKGEDGKTPVVTIGENGNWFIDGVDTHVSALGGEGEKGEQGIQGEKGDKGKDGKDGVSVMDVQIAYGLNIDGETVMRFTLYMSNNTTIVEEVVVNKFQELPEITKEASVGLEYTLSADGTYYIVTGVGTCIDEEIVIPSTYEGKLVKEIGEEAFGYCFNIKSVIISEGITTIGVRAFAGCEKISNVQFPDSLISIQEWAFYYCRALPTVEFSNNLRSIGEYAFYNCDCLVTVKLPDGLLSIEEGAFRMTGLRSVHIPQSITVIGKWAFTCNYVLKCVELPKNIATMGNSIFEGCSRLTQVYYHGNAEEWAKLLSESSNDELKSLICYYYSETQPTGEGNYWHYDENGEIAVW